MRRLPRFPFAGETDAIASVDASRDLDRQGLGLLVATLAMTLAARILMILPRPWQCGQACCTAKKPWRICTWPEPWRVGQVWAELPVWAPEPLQTSQWTRVGTLISGDPAYRLFQRQLHGVAQIGPRAGPRRPPPRLPPKYRQTRRRRCRRNRRRRQSRRGHRHPGSDPPRRDRTGHSGHADWHRSDLVGFLDLFELLFGPGIALVAVRVILHGQTLVRLLDLAFVGILDTPSTS